jgi:hypothetical protein
MSNSSPQKLCLLELAKVNLERAEYYLSEAKLSQSQIDHMMPSSALSHRRLISNTSTASSSSSPSVSSVLDSVFSSRCSSPMHSPSSSVDSTYSTTPGDANPPLKPRPLRIRKKVSFSPVTVPQDITPGMENRSPTRPVAPFRSFSSPLPGDGYSKDSYTPTMENYPSDDMSSFFQARSVSRYNAQLATLALQITYHMSVLDSLIEKLQATPRVKPATPRITPKTPEKAASPLRPCTPRSSASRPATPRPSTPTRAGGAAYSLYPKVDYERHTRGRYTTGASIANEDEPQDKRALREVRIAELNRRGEEWAKGKRRVRPSPLSSPLRRISEDGERSGSSASHY